jgi:hypothetical protein
MSHRSLASTAAALFGALALAPAVATAQQPITLRVEGATHTVVKKSQVTPGQGSFSKDGDPAHACTASTAAGALETATGGSWGGSWSDGLGYFVQTIRGETHSGSPDFWSLWVNHRPSTTGVCQTEPEAGDDLLFLVDRCVFDAAKGACSNKPVLPLELRLPGRAATGTTVTVTVVAYDEKGKARPLAKASVLRDGTWLGKTDGRGHFRLRLRSKAVTLTALKRGYSRSEPVRATLGN